MLVNVLVNVQAQIVHPFGIFLATLKNSGKIPTFCRNVGILPEFCKVNKKMPKAMHNWPLDIDQHFDVILISKSISMMQFLRLEIDRHKIEL